MSLESRTMVEDCPSCTPWSEATRSVPSPFPREPAAWGTGRGVCGGRTRLQDPKTSFGFGRTFVAVDLRSKKVLWKHSEQDYIDGRGVAMKNARVYYYCPGRFLACLDGGAGQVLWRTPTLSCWRRSAPPVPLRIQARAIRPRRTSNVMTNTCTSPAPSGQTWRLPRRRMAGSFGDVGMATCIWCCATTASTASGRVARSSPTTLGKSWLRCPIVARVPGRRVASTASSIAPRRGPCGSTRPTTRRGTLPPCGRLARMAW